LLLDNIPENKTWSLNWSG